MFFMRSLWLFFLDFLDLLCNWWEKIFLNASYSFWKNSVFHSFSFLIISSFFWGDSIFLGRTGLIRLSILLTLEMCCCCNWGLMFSWLTVSCTCPMEIDDKNKKLRKDVSLANMYKEHYFDNKRICFSHEYIGSL